MPPDSIVQGKTRGVEAGVADIQYGYKQNTTFKEVATSNSNSLKLVTRKPLVSRKSRKHITQRAEAVNNRTGAKLGSTKKSQPPAKKLRSASLFGCCVGVLSPLPLKLRLCFLSGVHNHNLSKLYPDFYVAMLREELWVVLLVLCLCCL